MGDLFRRRPSAAMVVGLIALIVAASGTAVAATKLVKGDSLIKKNSLSGNRLKKNSLPGNRLRNRSVTGSKIKLSSLGTVPRARHASTADTATSATTASAAPLSKVTYVSTTEVVAPTATTTSPPTQVIATCPAGTTVIGGGASVSSQAQGLVNDSYPSGKTSWVADVFNNTGAGSATLTSTVTAICAPAAATAP